MLSPDGKKLLLDIARSAIENQLGGVRTKSVPPKNPSLLVEKGVFVTLTKERTLRGCIGRIEPRGPLFQTVAEVAKAAAFQDPRFSPITASELPDIAIEISILSSLTQLQEINALEVGRHGLLIRRGFASGLLLPQVASENRWSKEEFVGQVCLKAALPVDAWRETAAELFTFTAEVFSEEDV